MYAEKMLLETDPQGRLKTLPTLPPTVGWKPFF